MLMIWLNDNLGLFIAIDKLIILGLWKDLS